MPQAVISSLAYSTVRFSRYYPLNMPQLYSLFWIPIYFFGPEVFWNGIFISSIPSSYNFTLYFFYFFNNYISVKFLFFFFLFLFENSITSSGCIFSSLFKKKKRLQRMCWMLKSLKYEVSKCCCVSCEKGVK